ncbi:hypothetical protein UlMin_005865 [Ulmus minor]
MEEQEHGVEDLVKKTTLLCVEKEQDWEDVKAEVETSAELSLVERWISKKPCSKKFITTVLGRLWGDANGWKVRIPDQKENSCFVGFSFKDKNRCKQTLLKASWLLNIGVLLLAQWPTTRVYKDAALETMVCWNRAMGIPAQMLSVNNVKRIASMVGRVLECRLDHIQAAIMRKIVRFKVEVAVDKALCPGRFVTWEGEKVWIQFKYEFLPYMCFACGVIDHDQRLCESKPEGIVDTSGSLCLCMVLG